MNRWISVSEALPEPLERVIMCVGGIFVGEGWLRENGDGWIRYDELLTVEEIFHYPVTHWMPLPSLPGGDLK